MKRLIVAAVLSVATSVTVLAADLGVGEVVRAITVRAVAGQRSERVVEDALCLKPEIAYL